MVALRNDQDLLTGRAIQLMNEGIAILGNPESTADDVAKADRMFEDAASMKARAKKLLEIQTSAGEQQDDPQQEQKRRDGATKGDFKDFPDFIKAIAKEITSKGQIRDQRLKVFTENDPEGRKDMSGATGGAGGYTIPIEQLATLMAVAAPMAIVRPRATVIRMGSRTVTMPILDQSGATAGVPSFFGGVRVYWQSEASALTSSDAGFKEAILTANELIGYTLVGNSLLQDAGLSLADLLSSKRGFPGAIAWQEDYEFIRGNGVGKPIGILSAAATKVRARTTGGTVKYDDIVNMQADFWGENPVWIATNGLKATLMAMAGPSATNYAGMYLWGNAVEGRPASLAGYPIFFTDKQPAVGTKGDLFLADWSAYVIGDRQATSVEPDVSVGFGSNKTAFRIIHRVDGQPWLPNVITLAGDSSTVSPFVVLNT